MLTLLSQAFATFGRAPDPPLPLRALRRAARLWLLKTIVEPECTRPDDVTVVIGVRNRFDHRLPNALRSIRAQEYPGAVRTIVVDDGSEPEQARGMKEISEGHGARYVSVARSGVWSRSRCLNVGLRLADTKFLMTSDVDVMLSPRYLADAVHVLGSAPLSVVCSRMLDLPQESAAEVARASDSGALRLEDWRRLAQPRYEWIHPSIGVGFTRFYQLIRGYDEYYEVWGMEDDDLMRRFTYLGLRPKALGTGSFYLHQWHPKMEGIPEGRNAEPVLRNQAYFRRVHSILRNDRDWGHAGRAG